MSMIRNVVFYLSLFFLCAGFTACTSSKLNEVYVTNTKKVPLLAPSSMDGIVECYEYFSGSFGEQSFAVTCYFTSDEEGMNILMLNDFGVQIGIIYYDGETAGIESSILPGNFKSEYILLDIQNAYYDADELKKHYKQYKLDFTQEVLPDGTKVRKVFNKKELIEEIRIIEKNISIKNYLRGYSYELTVVDDE